MGLLRDRHADGFAALDEQIAAVAAQLRQVGRDDLQRELLQGQIDELLDRRLKQRQDEVIRSLIATS